MSENIGNAASMREALEKFLDLARRGLAFFTSYQYSAAENEEIEAAFDAAKSALSAPPRNCDRFQTADAAWDAWTHGPGRLREGDGFVGLLDWLYAKEEGEA